jgi:hypothetical protein
LASFERLKKPDETAAEGRGKGLGVPFLQQRIKIPCEKELQMRKIKKTYLLVAVLVAVAVCVAGAALVSASQPVTYKVIAWNDLGMHCACPGAEYFTLLPPFNTVRAQVFLVGQQSAPTVVSSGVTVSYAMVENTDANLQSDLYFSNYIAFSPKLFSSFLDGTKPYTPVIKGKVVSISGAGLAGDMKYDSTKMAWEVVGIPAFPAVTGTSADIEADPIDSTRPKRDPYLTANITVKDTRGRVLATTSTVVPVAMGGCCVCHLDLAQANGYTRDPAGSFKYMGLLHGKTSGIDFTYIDPDGDGKPGPIRCSWCHWDPALGESAAPGLPAVWPNYKILTGANFTKSDIRISQFSLSDVLHRFHATDSLVLSQYDPNIVKNCYDCHPEPNTVVCYRGVHLSRNLWCTDCHGDLNQRVATGQLTQPWQESTLPTCNAPSPGITSAFKCHDENTFPTPGTWSGLFGKFLNSRGHKGSVLCSTCHGSPHALNPSTLAKDNLQLQNLQGQPGFSFPSGKNSSYPLGVCNVCHKSYSDTWDVPPHQNVVK